MPTIAKINVDIDGDGKGDGFQRFFTKETDDGTVLMKAGANVAGRQKVDFQDLADIFGIKVKQSNFDPIRGDDNTFKADDDPIFTRKNDKVTINGEGLFGGKATIAFKSFKDADKFIDFMEMLRATNTIDTIDFPGT